MHQNPAFRETPDDAVLAAALKRGFGVLTMVDGEEPLAAHAPFALTEDGDALEMHLMRSNPIARAVAYGPRRALMIVSGPDGYVSPDWYDTPDQVPTWNYVAQHIRGDLSLRPADALRDHLDRISSRFEAELTDKTPWSTAKMTPETLQRMMRQILPVRLSIGSVAGTWKLNQNKSPAARRGAAAQIAGGVGQELAALAALMRAVDDA